MQTNSSSFYVPSLWTKSLLQVQEEHSPILVIPKEKSVTVCLHQTSSHIVVNAIPTSLNLVLSTTDLSSEVKQTLYSAALCCM